jgi:transposase
MTRKTYPSDVTHEEWQLILPYLTLLPPDAPQRTHDLREVFNALRWIIRTGTQWRYLPHDFPHWQVVQQQAQRWIDRSCFENLVHDLREMLRLKQAKNAQPSASVIDSRFVPSTPESGHRAAYNGHKAKKGSKLHAVVDTLGNLMALCVTAGNVDDRKPVEDLCEQVQALTGESVRVMFADQGYTGEVVADEAEFQGIDLFVVNRPEGSRGFVLLPKRWVVERSFAWATRFRRLVRDYERLPGVFAGLHFAVFGILMVTKLLREVVSPT